MAIEDPNGAIKWKGKSYSSVMGDYPYADDGMLIWNAVHDWISAYLKVCLAPVRRAFSRHMSEPFEHRSTLFKQLNHDHKMPGTPQQPEQKLCKAAQNTFWIHILCESKKIAEL